MAYADGTITLTTGAIGTTFTVSGLSFQPTWIKFVASGRATSGFAEGDMRWCQGLAVSTTSRRAYAQQSDHGIATSATDKVRRTDCCVCALSTAGASAGKADLDAITSDGFRLIIDEVFGAALQVGWIAGDDANAEIIDIPENASGNVNYATSFALDTGIDDKCVIFIGATNNVTGTPEVGSEFCVGFVAGNTPVGAVLAGRSRDGQGTTVTCGYCRTGECIATLQSNTVINRATLTAWLSTGFTLNWAEVFSSTLEYSALVLQDTNRRYQVGDGVTRTDTTQAQEATTYTPQALIVISHGKAASASDTTQDHDERSVGFATSPTSRRVAFVNDKDAVTTNDIGVGYQEDAVYGNVSIDAAMVVEGLMDLVSFDATPGFTYVMDDADPGAAYFGYLLFSSVSSGYSITAEAGSYALAGQAVGLRVSRRVVAEVGVYTLTGQATALRQARRVSVDTGAYLWSGQAVDLRASRRLIVESGAYLWTGQPAGVLQGLRITAASGSYNLSGQSVGLYLGLRVTVESGSYSLSGQPVGLLANRRLVVSPGSYLWTGTDVGLTHTTSTYTIVADPGSYALSGSPVGLRWNRRIEVTTGSYLWTGSTVSLVYTIPGLGETVRPIGRVAGAGLTTIGLREFPTGAKLPADVLPAAFAGVQWNPVGPLTLNASLIVLNLPTADPVVAGQLWNDSGIVRVSAG